MGSGSTTSVAPASQVAWMAVTSSPRLQGSGVALGPVVEVPPGHDILITPDHEGDGGVTLGSALDASKEREHAEWDHRGVARVTSG
jgi:hypothetical protein